MTSLSFNSVNKTHFVLCQFHNRTVLQLHYYNEIEVSSKHHLLFPLVKSASGLLSTAVLSWLLSRCVYICVVEMLSCPSSSWRDLISTLPYLYISVAAVWRSLWVEYRSGSRPAALMYFLTIFCTDSLLILRLRLLR